MSSTSTPHDTGAHQGPQRGQRLTLFVAGSSQRSQSAMAQLRRIVEDQRALDWTLEVVDVLTHPADAARAGIVATPTVVVHVDGREHRAVGCFEDRNALFSALQLTN